MSDTPQRPFPLPRHLLWEYDLDTLDYERHHRIIIERIIERGGMEEWVGAQAFYGKQRFLEVVEWSRQLGTRDKDFAKLFIDSDYHHVY